MQNTKLNVNNLLSILVTAFLALYSWQAEKLVSSVDDLKKMVYEHDVKIGYIEHKIGISSNYDYNPPLSQIPARDGTAVSIFNSEMCILSHTKKNKKEYNA